MNRRITLATIFAVLVGLFASSTALAASPADRAPYPPPTTYWQNKGFILMAHQGGEWDFPPNTLFAYKSAMANGADMIDMDAYVTSDGKIVLTHDLQIYKNTESPQGDNLKINELTLEQLKTYDFAYDWSPHDGSATTPYRGIANGSVPPPAGFTANDFKIPTFAEVLAAFPDTPINIELKQVAGVDIEDTAAEMASILAAHPGHDENVIINSFGQEMLDAVHAARPQHKSFGGSQNATLAYVQGGEITPRPVALEPPDYFNLGSSGSPLWARTVPLLKPWADHDGYQIYVWGSDHDPAQDTDPFYETLIAEGADSYNTPSPLTLAKYLCENGIGDMNGEPRCAQQVCPEGFTGIAPDNCTKIPVTTVTKISLSPAKKTIKAGKNLKMKIKVNAVIGLDGMPVIKLKSSNRQVKVPKVVTFKPGTSSKFITVKTTKKAKGKARITASALGKKGIANLSIKAAKKCKGSNKVCGKTNHF